MHVETNVRATIAAVYLIFSFHDEDVWSLGDPGAGMEKDAFESHVIAAECQDVVFTLKVNFGLHLLD